MEKESSKAGRRKPPMAEKTRPQVRKFHKKRCIWSFNVDMGMVPKCERSTGEIRPLEREEG